MEKPSLDQCRYFLKDSIRQEIDFSQTDQHMGVEPPPLEKPYPADATLIGLPPAGQWQGIEPVDLVSAIGDRQSRATSAPNRSRWTNCPCCSGRLRGSGSR